MTPPPHIPCPYCERQALPVTGAVLYPHRPDLARKRFYLCSPCNAYCGTHPDGRPLGRPADATLRRARNHVHELFDPLWQKVAEAYEGEDNGKLRGVARARAYRWLAERMGIEVPDCHVAMFDVYQCRQAYRILRDDRPTAVSIRAWSQARKVAQGATRS